MCAVVSGDTSGEFPEALVENFSAIFTRMSQPLYTYRENVHFVCPNSFLREEEREIADALNTNVGSSTIIHIPDFKGEKPDLSKAKVLPRNVRFSIFDKTHREAANDLIRIFMDAPADQFFTTVAYARDQVNPYLFVYAVSVAALHRRREPGIKGLVLPSHVSVFPQLYIRSDICGKGYLQTALPETLRTPIEIPVNYTATDLDVEHRVAYFREDIGVNAHHWHWHIVYPGTSDPKYPLVNKDRRGELFYYMHQQIVARYNFERLCNNLARVRRFENLRAPMLEGYYPKLNCSVAKKGLPSRQPNSVLQNLNRNIGNNSRYEAIDVYDLELWRNRIMDAIHNGYYLAKDANGKTITVQWEEATGIDILGNIIEASDLSVNRGLYGDFHNLGHLAIASVHDPDHRFQEDLSVMGDSTTAMRDPIFYVWHALLDDIFQKYKATLAPYTKEKLTFDGIEITNVEILSDEGERTGNEFYTFWEKSDVNVSGGLDGQVQGKVLIRWTHLQHNRFTYSIEVNNKGKARKGTVRIFLAPERDEGQGLLRFEDQRRLFIELDKFTTTLPAGTSTIQQKSTDSSVTIPLKQLLGSSTNVFCGCGWPAYLLIPKGSAGGIPARLFVMISDAAEDAVPKSQVVSEDCGCETIAPSYCGLDGLPYPDKKAMGYPFDRPSSALDLDSFIEKVPNMFVQKTLIKFDESRECVEAPIET